jgi:hypothetical protein
LEAHKGLKTFGRDSFADVVAHHFLNLPPGHRVSIGPFGRHRFADISNRDDRCGPRQLGRVQAAMIAVAVEPLMMRARDVR